VLVVAYRAAQAGCADDPADLIEPARQRGQLNRLALELELAAADNVLATLERRPVQLDGAELAPPLVDLRLGADEGSLAAAEVRCADIELGLAHVELGCALPQDLFDPGVKLASLLLPPLEVGDRAAELCGALLELAAPRRDELGERVLVVGRSEERAQATEHAVLGRRPSGPLIPASIPFRMPLHRRLAAPATHPQPSSSNEPPAPLDVRRASSGSSPNG
jgi:hypothetical protein